MQRRGGNNRQSWDIYREHVLIQQGEPFHQTKARIQERLGVAEKDFAKFKFSLVSTTVFKQPSAIEDGEFLLSTSLLFDVRKV